MTLAVPGYTEITPLGSGATGTVVLARHESTQQLVAIKHLSSTLVRDGDFVQRFRSEAMVLRELDHPNIVRVHEYLEQNGEAALVMELVHGVSLRSLIAGERQFEPETALVVLNGSLLGLERAHSAGIVHRDYKPENVLVDEAGTSRLLDFGIALRSGERGWQEGTPAYMAPEQWSTGEVSPRSDVYAATAVFYECLVGRPPFVSDDLGALRAMHENAPVPAGDVPGPVRELVRRGLAKEPAQRFPSGAAFLEELHVAAASAYGVEWLARGGQTLAGAAVGMVASLPLTAALGGSGAATAGSAASSGGMTTAINVGGAPAAAPPPAPPPAAPPPAAAPPPPPPPPAAVAAAVPPTATPLHHPAGHPPAHGPVVHHPPRPTVAAASSARRRRRILRGARIAASAGLVAAGVLIARSGVQPQMQTVGIRAGLVRQDFTGVGTTALDGVPTKPNACASVDVTFVFHIGGGPTNVQLASGQPFTIRIAAVPASSDLNGASQTSTIAADGTVTFRFIKAQALHGGTSWTALPSQIGSQPIQPTNAQTATTGVKCP